MSIRRGNPPISDETEFLNKTSKTRKVDPQRKCLLLLIKLFCLFIRPQFFKGGSIYTHFISTRTQQTSKTNPTNLTYQHLRPSLTSLLSIQIIKEPPASSMKARPRHMQIGPSTFDSQWCEPPTPTTTKASAIHAVFQPPTPTPPPIPPSMEPYIDISKEMTVIG